ncbi:hypothetical protein [Tahibacter sp.]|uniref:hypothetical protein n=1 Tax=Tahibacter sp. TaxID=2056211 RepID=UPI0028C4436E|nr:hypothetical protein [Tahibacter sp.]
MGEARFRVWFGERAASEDELRRIEDIEVVQAMDQPWEARLNVVLCVDANGAWLHWPGDTAEPFSRVRVEIDVGDGDFVALIDGPLVGIDASLDSQPGRSGATLLVRDDSAFLNRDEETEPPWEFTRDSAIVEELFGRFAQIAQTDIEPTEATPAYTTRRGTVMDFLYELAALNDRHVYVLPGAEPGQSIGCFLPDPTEAGALPALVLLGSARNLVNASIVQDPDAGGEYFAQTLSIDDQGVASLQNGASELGLLRDLPAVPLDLRPRRLLHPADNTRADASAALEAQARRDGYVYRLTSQVVPGCYAAVLTPYQKVRVDAGATPYSGDYLIERVTHRITPSQYSQELEAKADSVSAASSEDVAEALGGGLSLSFSASVGIF